MIVVKTQDCQVQVSLVDSKGKPLKGPNMSFKVLLVDSGGQLGLPSVFPTESEHLLVLSQSMRLVEYTAE